MSALRAFAVAALGAGGVLAGMSAQAQAPSGTAALPPRTSLPAGTSVVARPVHSLLLVYRRRGARVPFARLSARTIGRSPRVLLVRRMAGDWTQLWLPLRPNGTRGWARSSDLRFERDDWSVRVMLAAHRLEVNHDGRTALAVQIAEGTHSTPTPRGRFFVTELLRQPDPRGEYGPWVFVLSGFSPVLTRFHGGDGEIGIHGTNAPALIGRDVSHGCIRMRNGDIARLVRILPLGTPVDVVGGGPRW